MSRKSDILFSEGKTEDLDFKCNECEKMFLKKAALLSHKKWKHEVEDSCSCDKCHKTFSKKSNLRRHIKENCNNPEKNIMCSLCDFLGANKAVVINHYRNTHDIKLKEKHLEFSDFAMFETWKENFEKETKAKFIKASGTKRLKCNVKISSYVCHRDGCFNSQSKGIRQIKLLGSNKINSYCPAQINVRESENIVKISCIETHIGHGSELGRLTLTSSEKASIYQKIALKVPFQEILDNIRDTANDGNSLERIHFTRKDLWNIVESYNLRRLLENNNNSENFEEETVLSEISTSSVSADKKKSELLKIFLKTFNKIKNEQQLQAAYKEVTRLDTIVNLLGQNEGSSFPETLKQEPANKHIELQ